VSRATATKPQPGGSALALARDAGLWVLEGQSLSALAEVHLARNEPLQAVEHANRALAVHRATGHRLGAAATRRLLDALATRRLLDALAEPASPPTGTVPARP
jgi:hypothetical protein